MSKKQSKNNRVIQHAHALAERDGGWFCHYCGVPLVPTDAPFGIPPYYFQIGEHTCIEPPYKRAFCDHKIAVANGGGNDLDNLVLTCLLCNSKKGAMPYEDFIKQIKGMA